MRDAKKSINADDQLRLAAKAIIVLRNEKLAGIARALQFDPGGISGWLGGTPNRLSLEKKELLSTYLGLEYTHISAKIVHRWQTCSEDISTLLPVVINQEMLQHIFITTVTSDTIPIGCIYHSKIGETTLVALCNPKSKAFPIPVVSPKETGWGTLLPSIEMPRSTWESWWLDKNVSPNEITETISNSK